MRSLLLFSSIICCFSYSFSQWTEPENSNSKKEVSHSFYITSNVGNVPFNEAQKILEQINNASVNDNEATLLLIGNVLDKEGFSSHDDEQNEVKNNLQPLMNLWDNFNGNVILTPGENEWLKDAPQSIDDLESFLQDNSKAKFWPNDGCPLEKETINNEVVLEMVDSQWFLEDW